MEAPPGGSPASPAEAEAVILGTQKGMTAPPTLSLLMTTGSATLSHFQQRATSRVQDFDGECPIACVGMTKTEERHV